MRIGTPASYRSRSATLLRAALLVDAGVFLVAALLNLSVQVPLGFTTLRFSAPVWQAGVGEAVIGVTLLLAGLRAPRRLSWVAFWMSAFGIAFGLASHRVQGAARGIHVVLVPLAVVVLALLLGAGRRHAPAPARPGPGGGAR